MKKLLVLCLAGTMMTGCMHCVKCEEEVETKTVTSAPAPQPAPPAPAPVTYQDITFERNKAALTPAGQAEADKLVHDLQTNPSHRAEIGGYASGESEALAQQRATVVRDYVVSRGVAADRIQVRSYGATAGDDRLGRKVTISVR